MTGASASSPSCCRPFCSTIALGEPPLFDQLGQHVLGGGARDGAGVQQGDQLRQRLAVELHAPGVASVEGGGQLAHQPAGRGARVGSGGDRVGEDAAESAGLAASTRASPGARLCASISACASGGSAAVVFAALGCCRGLRLPAASRLRASKARRARRSSPTCRAAPRCGSRPARRPWSRSDPRRRSRAARAGSARRPRPKRGSARVSRARSGANPGSDLP